MTETSLMTAFVPADLAAVAETPLYEGFDPNTIALHGCDAHLALLRAGTPVARCSLWWSSTPKMEGERLGVVGHYASADDEAASELLAAACSHLAEQGCTRAVGPMDGNTWRRYRFVTERGPEPPFFLEPDNPDAYPAQWDAAGFEPLAAYFSALDEDLTRRDPRLPKVAERLAADGIVIRAFDPSDAEADLGRVYDVSLASFANNFLYTPLAEDEFRAQYRAILPHARPELALLAEDAGQTVGFMFAIPDLAQKMRGEQVDTVILKTVAVLPGRRHAGLGALLVEQVQLAAAQMGFRRAIHALMFESNTSRSISAHYATTMRRYTLYTKRLLP